MLEVVLLHGHVLLLVRLLEENLLQHFMELIILIVQLKKFYNSVMVKSDLIIAGSNFIFSHINENYSNYLNKNKNY